MNSETYQRNGVDYFSCSFSPSEADILGNTITSLMLRENSGGSAVEAMQGGLIDFRDDGAAVVKMRRENADNWLTATGQALVEYQSTLNQYLEKNMANISHGHRQFLGLQIGRAIGMILSLEHAAYRLSGPDDKQDNER
jgi:hypothetical protein